MAGEEAVEEKGRAIKEQCGAYKDEEIVGGGGGGQAGEPPWSHNWLHRLCRPRALATHLSHSFSGNWLKSPPILSLKGRCCKNHKITKF